MKFISDGLVSILFIIFLMFLALVIVFKIGFQQSQTYKITKYKNGKVVETMVGNSFNKETFPTLKDYNGNNVPLGNVVIVEEVK